MQSGDKLGPYELVSALGAGGMGEVWKARDTRLDRFVAIKVSKESFNDRFLQEARTIAKLDHPHICRLYDVGPNYLVMELLDGKPLSGPLPLPDCPNVCDRDLQCVVRSASRRHHSPRPEAR